MQEVLGLIAPHLDEEALARFNRYLKPGLRGRILESNDVLIRQLQNSAASSL